MSDLLRKRVESLENEVELLLERIEQLEGEVLGREWFCPIEFCLTPSQQRLLAALISRERCSKEFLHMASTKPGVEAESELKIIDVWICKMRPKLQAFGINIQTVWGFGYMLSPEDQARLRNWKTGDADGSPQN